MSRLEIPAHAVRVGRAVSLEADAVIMVWHGKASDGYKTDFTAREAVWWQLCRNGRTVRVMRRSGRGLAEIAEAWADMLTIPGLEVDVAVPASMLERWAGKPAPAFQVVGAL